jgi:hypothetical protein
MLFSRAIVLLCREQQAVAADILKHMARLWGAELPRRGIQGQEFGHRSAIRRAASNSARPSEPRSPEVARASRPAGATSRRPVRLAAHLTSNEFVLYPPIAHFRRPRRPPLPARTPAPLGRAARDPNPNSPTRGYGMTGTRRRGEAVKHPNANVSVPPGEFESSVHPQPPGPTGRSK